MAAAGIPSGQDPSARLVLAGNVVVSSEPWVWSFNYNAHSVLCAQCFTEIKNLRTCSGCKLYRYCNTECQSVNWKKEHKLECALLKTIHEQLQPFIAKGVFNHDCSLGGCYMFGCCAGEILVAKVLNKIMVTIPRYKEEVSGYTGNVTAQQVLDALSLQPTYPRQANIFERLNHQVCAAIWPSAVISRIPQFEVLVQKLMYNALPILNQRGKFKLQMMGIFPQALQRAMTPVCLDINVTMDLQGRTLVVRAVKDIHYTGLKDLRQNEEVHKSFYVALKERQGDFERFYGFSCACGKCNDKYEAEINPLRCCTVGCPARIPSDVRALQPCPECGADNVPQLLKLKAVMAAHDQMGDSDPDQCFQEMAQSLAWVKELDTVVHPDAHLRFTCGYDIADFMQATMRYEEAWNLVGGMIDCVRAMYPLYHLGRARYLVKSAAIPYLWKRVVEKKDKQRLAPVLREALPKALGWLREAEDIYRKVSGEDSVWAQAVVDFIRIHAPAEVSTTENTVKPARKANWNWGSWEAVFRW